MFAFVFERGGLSETGLACEPFLFSVKSSSLEQASHPIRLSQHKFHSAFSSLFQLLPEKDDHLSPQRHGMTSSLKHLPPAVARELRRHVSPRPQHARASLTDEPHPSSMRRVVVGCVAFTATAACIPMAAWYWMGGLNDKEEPLTAPQVRRGAYMNSGTRDMGRDPDWEQGVHKLKSEAGYAAMVEQEKESSKRMSGEYLAVAADHMKKHEEKMKAFAEGRARND